MKFKFQKDQERRRAESSIVVSKPPSYDSPAANCPYCGRQVQPNPEGLELKVCERKECNE